MVSGPATHRFAAHPDDTVINREALQEGLATMLGAYLLTTVAWDDLLTPYVDSPATDRSDDEVLRAWFGQAGRSKALQPELSRVGFGWIF